MKPKFNHRYDMMLSMQDPFDYEEYVRLCGENNFTPFDALQYSLQVGVLRMAVRKYPKLFHEHAMKEFQLSIHRERTQNKGTQAAGCKKCSEKNVNNGGSVL